MSNCLSKLDRFRNVIYDTHHYHYCYAEGRYAVLNVYSKCRYAECYYADCYAKCHVVQIR
jgi:hypothetical protein